MNNVVKNEFSWLKFFLAPLLFLLTWVFACAVFGQDVATSTPIVVAPMPTEDFIALLLQSLGGLKGASTLAIVGIVVKILLNFANSELFGKWFGKLKGAWKLTIVLALSMVSGVVSLMSVSGLSFTAALIHSSSLSAFVVLANQLYKQFIEKKD